MKTVNICGIPHKIRYKHTIAEEDADITLEEGIEGCIRILEEEIQND